MSIYRPVSRFDPDASDVSHFAQRSVAASAPPSLEDPDPGAARWGHLRRVLPEEALTPETVRWAARLPDDVRPYALMKRYARIANRLATCAHVPRSLFDCFADLLIDRRGGRRGFPADVSLDLMRLRDYYERLGDDADA